jgi:hypothetical protein
MWVEVGRYVPAIGPWWIVAILGVGALAILGTIVILVMVGKSPISQGEVRVRPLGIRVRWGQPEESSKVNPESTNDLSFWKKLRNMSIWKKFLLCISNRS